MAIKSLKYCNRCVMPETTEGIEFDENGICTACTSSEQKMHINWNERREMLDSLLNKAKKDAKKNDSPYDCIVPISGGKDSTYQLHVLLKVYKLRVLAVTFSHNWYSKIGFYNLVNCLEEFNVDHIQFTPNRQSVGVAARKSLKAIGDACWHCHSGVGSFPLHIAVKFKIPLLIWGESIAEASGRASHFNPVLKFDRDYFNKVSAKKTADEMIDDEITAKDIHPFQLPSYDEIDKTGVWGLHLGDYVFWDDEKQTEFISETYGWKETEIENAYKGYKSAECIMAGLHDFTCYLKRGFGRATMQAAADVRNGLLSRQEGFELIKKHDQEKPEALKYFLQITSLSNEEFFKIMDHKKLESLKDITLKVRNKKSKNAEEIKPFMEQIIDKHLNRIDPRITKKLEK